MTEILAAKLVAGEMKLNEAHREEGLCAAEIGRLVRAIFWLPGHVDRRGKSFRACRRRLQILDDDRSKRLASERGQDATAGYEIVQSMR